MDSTVNYWFLYIARNIALPLEQREGRGSRFLYVGITNNVMKRLDEHNKGRSKGTKGGLWELVTVVPFRQKRQAAIVESWLKNGDTRQKREEVIRRAEGGNNSELLGMKFFAFAEKWYERRLGLENQGGLDI